MKFKVGDIVKCLVTMPGFWVEGAIGKIVSGPTDFVLKTDGEFFPSEIGMTIYGVFFDPSVGEMNPAYIPESGLEIINTLTTEEKVENHSFWDSIAE